MVESHSRWEDAKLGTCENVSDIYKTPLAMFEFSRFLLVDDSMSVRSQGYQLIALVRIVKLKYHLTSVQNTFKPRFSPTNPLCLATPLLAH